MTAENRCYCTADERHNGHASGCAITNQRRHQQTIDESMALLNAVKASRLTDAQLQANVSTYKSSADGSANERWREACVREQSNRQAS